MVATGAISDTQRAEAEAIPVDTEVTKRAPKEATVAESEKGTQFFVDYVRRQLVRTYGEDAVLRGGLRVQTTLDPKLQRQAYDAVYGTLNWRGDPAGALVTLDNDGHVLAMVGGKDWNESKVNLAVGAAGGGAGRQAGSAFKPFVLGETVREGYTVESSFLGPAAITLPHADTGNKDWKVSNFEDEAFVYRT